MGLAIGAHGLSLGAIDSEIAHLSELEGILGGAFVGHNWVLSGPYVLGVEGEIFLSDVQGNRVLNGDVTIQQSVQQGAALRVLAGYQMDEVLPYTAIGLATGIIDTSVSAPGEERNGRTRLTGITFAVGLDYANSATSFWRIEVRHTDYGDGGCELYEIPNVPPLTISEFTTTEVRIGYALRF